MNFLYKLFCAIICSAATTSLYGGNYLLLDNGYRWDRISNRATLGGPTVSVKGSSQTLRNISTYQLGLKGQWEFCPCGFVRGSGHYGWVVGHGDYFEGGFVGHAKGYTYDLQGAFGYYICLTPFVELAPIVGWSYDALNLKGTDIHTAIDGTVFKLSDIKAHQRFNGPFLGFDLLYNVDPCFNVTFGYELHFARWNGQRDIQGPEYGNPPFGSSTGFSNRRRINCTIGNVFKLDGIYQLCNCWQVGLGLKFQFFRGNAGSYRQTKVPIIPQFSYSKVNGLWWSSFAATISIGRTF